MKTVGKTLKSARENKGVDIREVSNILKIREKYLLALELGNYSEFSSGLYAKGFLKNYSKYLGLEEEEMLALYRREYDIKDEGLIVSKDQHVRSIKLSLKPGYIIAIVIIATVVVVIGYLYLQYKTYSSPPTLTLNIPANPEVVTSDNIIISGKTNGNVLSINGDTNQQVNSDGTFNVPFILSPGQNTIKISVSNSASSLATSNSITRTIIYNNNVSNTPTQTTATNISGLIAISKNSPKGVWVDIISDGIYSFSGILEPGDQKKLIANKELRITIGNGSYATLTLNSQTIQLNPGIIEKVIDLDSSGNLVFN